MTQRSIPLTTNQMIEFNWSSNFETMDLEPQNPELLAMFINAYLERGFNISDESLKAFVGTGEFRTRALDHWIQLQNVIYSLQFTWVKPPGRDLKTWFDANGKNDSLWPPPRGFRRFFRRVITYMNAPGKINQVARFEYNTDSSWRKLTPPLEKYHTGHIFKHDGTKWNQIDDPKIQADIVYRFGRIRKGDFWGGHILNDLRDAINLLYMQSGQGLWSTGIEETNARVSWAGAKDLKHTNAVQSAASENWGGDLSVLDGDILQYAKSFVNDGSTGITFERGTQVGTRGSLTINAIMDRSLWLCYVSPANRHGVGILKVRDDGNAVKYQAPYSEKFGDWVELTPQTPDIINTDQMIQFAEIVADGEDANKFVKICRVWEPFSEEFNGELAEARKGVSYSEYGAIISKGDEVGVIAPDKPQYVQMSDTPLISYDSIDDEGHPVGVKVIGSAKRKSVGRIRADSSISMAIDSFNGTFCAGPFLNTLPIGSSIPCIDTSGPMAISAVLVQHDQSGGVPLAGDVAILFHQSGYPYFQGKNQTATDSQNVFKKTGRKVTFFVTDFGPNIPLQWNNNFDPIAQYPVLTEIGFNQGTSYELYGPKFGNPGRRPATWPDPPLSQEEIDATYGKDNPRAPKPSNGRMGYGPAIVLVLIDFSVKEGFKYKAGYNGK
jgi:hypothetical protein